MQTFTDPATRLSKQNNVSAGVSDTPSWSDLVKGQTAKAGV